MQDKNKELDQQLKELAEYESALTSVQRFAADPERFKRLSCTLGDNWLFDFSKQSISPQALSLLCDWARSQRLEPQITQLFSDNQLNNTEKRAVLHTALRMPANAHLEHNGKNVIPDVQRVLSQMRNFCAQVHSGQWRGITGKPISHIVNIGIGGSDLGPAMVVRALRAYQQQSVQVQFVSNMDGADLTAVLAGLDPEQTLFIVSSKTFTTAETLTNALSAKRWLLERLSDGEETESQTVSHHFVAVTSNVSAAVNFGVAPDNCFEFWDWVGGRFSLWSAVGLSIALAIGFEQFEQLLQGAYLADCHLRDTPLEQNVPVLMALFTHWNSRYLNLNTEAIFPYSQDMALFADYLQQLGMESNGKSVDRQGEKITEPTCPLMWGAVGSNGQHAFFQLFHQGSHVIAADFIGFVQPNDDFPEHQTKLLANLFAQTAALAFGRSRSQVEAELSAQGLTVAEIAELAPYMVMDGNRPSTTLLCKRITPYSLGTLLALYEHKTAILGMLWNINSFDQWGVELGKKLAIPIAKELATGIPSHQHDASTNGLIDQACAWAKR
ncbi:glucose-6-phosphate isomerase [Oceanisphaera sp. IT1-181]|uniref:glucose-6-phosphate isomerase n=1 Tax=Oceanisphaera sp. IT1-181 TaxID=3081199 RepID=UPI0029CAA1FA|nr:glucose-6-phosphate isomerase [Oceanisphaera sp. IT1-181]